MRVGILIDSFVQPQWVYKLIENVQASRVARIALVIKNSPAEAGTENKSKLRRYWENRDTLLYSLFLRIDERRTRAAVSNAPDAFEPKSIEPLVSACPVVEVKTERKKFSDWFDDESIAEISRHNLDVGLRFGFRILRGRALAIARHGVWSYHHADGAVNRGGPPGFWEVVRNEPTTGAMLQILTEELDNGRVIYRSISPTSDKFSVKANKNHYYWKASRFMMRKLRELYETGDVRAADTDSSFRPYHHRLYKTPNNRELFPLLRRMAGRYARGHAEDKRFFNQWTLRYKFKSSPTDRNDAFYRFKELTPPRDRFWADPFPVKSGDKYFIFIEELVYDERTGVISVLEIDRKGNFTRPVRVLERDYHLSYPFIFERAGAHFMIPETAANRTVELYRATEFPFEWKFERNLLENVRATDATLFESDARWWMFANLAEGDFPPDWNELYLFHTDDPVNGAWTPHRRNPVKSDARSSRPAGKLFRHNGELYRPAQNSTPYYGYGITINKIMKLDTDEFMEQPVSSITPSWDVNLVGTHTLNTAEDLTVIDCLVKRRK